MVQTNDVSARIAATVKTAALPHPCLEYAAARPFTLIAIAAAACAIAITLLGAPGFLLLALLFAVAAIAIVLESRAAAIARAATAHKAELTEAVKRAEEASLAKSRFLAMVSHEVRTPLNGILGMTHLLDRTTLSPEQQSHVTAVRQSGAALFDLVEDLLDFSAIEAGKVQPRIAPTDLCHLVEDAVELMASKAQEKSIEIAAYVAPDVPRIIETDHNRLRQVLFNLIGNAVKFTDKGGILVEVTRQSDALVLKVCDTGPGLAESDRERIFAEFEQVHMGSTRKHGGVGLGLAISARIVTAMGGAISVESMPGSGSTFIVTLPVRDLTTSAERNSEDAKRFSGRHVLLVMPDGQTADALARQIADGGGKVCHAVSIEASKQGLTPRRPFTDIIVDQRICAARAFPGEVETGSPPGNADKQRAGPADFSAIDPENEARRTLLVTPMDRAALETRREHGFDAWLVAPVRRSSLAAVLAGDAEPASARHEAISADETIAAPSTRAIRILVAEDNPVNALLMTGVLKRDGHAVTLVDDGRALVAEAFDADTGVCRFDLIVTDLSMPHMDGAAAVSHIRALERKRMLQSTPILVLSADGQEETRLNLLAKGADYYLEKPVDPTALLHLVARIAA